MNERQPLVSILVPVYNAESYLRKCLDSIAGQTYEHLEIILVDDGSTDGSGAICDAYAAKDERIKVIHKENGGVSSARNACLDNATGEYIQFVDSDDWIDPTITEKLVTKALANSSDVVQCGIATIEGGKNPRLCSAGYASDYYPAYSPAEQNPLVFFLRTRCDFSIDSLCSKLILRATIEQYNLRFVSTKEIGYEDSLFLTSLFAVLQRADFMSDPLYFYMIRENSIMTSLRVRIPQVVELVQRFEAFCRANGKHKELRRFFCIYAFSFTWLELERARTSNSPEQWEQTYAATAQLHAHPAYRRYFFQAAFSRTMTAFGKMSGYPLVERAKARVLALAIGLGWPKAAIALRPIDPKWRKVKADD